MTHQHPHSARIEACVRCAYTCEICAEACLGVSNVTAMAECIRLDRDCAEICWLASEYMSRNSHFAADLCRVCAEICDACEIECQKHEVEHCQRCAKACHHCAEECRQLTTAAA